MGYPASDTEAARRLGAALRRVGYSEDALLEMLGDDAVGPEPDELAVYERRLSPTRLGTVVRALFLQLPVARDQLVRALGAPAVEALVRVGLADSGTPVLARARLLPLEELLVASDDHPKHERVPRNYVAAYTPTSRLCDALTPRRRGGRVLDVGTGSGVQAILAARHATRVVATDVNPRALAFTDLNAALNGFSNVETRRGSFFDAVAGERFDLITCNAPYVVSPENRWAFRDSGMRGDDVTRHVVREAAAHLADGGFATVVGSWLGEDEERADDRPFEWAKALPECDAWILSAWESAPLEHAASWNSEIAGKQEQFSAALDAWIAYLDELKAGWVSEGAILLHRRPGRRHGARVDGLDDEALDDAGDQVRRAFENRAQLSSEDLLMTRPKLAMQVQLERELPAAARARVVLVGGTCSIVETTAAALGIVEKLDGSRTLRALDPSGAERTLVRELAELGAVRL